MRLVLLGGPRFLGRAITDSALERGHEFTFFNRGTTNPDCTRRSSDSSATGRRTSRRWRADVGRGDRHVRVPASGGPRIGRDARRLGLYCFVSTVSVYADFTQPTDESSPVAELGDLADDEVTGESYGALKALCEEQVHETFGNRALVVRPGLIVGPHDPTGRFTYWPHRVARGGEVLAPGPSDRPTQFIDVRDLAEWMLDVCERGVGGTFNATHPGIDWGELLDTCASEAASDARMTWVTDEFLVERGVGEWMELPLWVSALDPEAAYFDRVDVNRAVEESLTFRPLSDTVRGTLDLAETTDAAGLAPERESALLAEWHGRR